LFASGRCGSLSNAALLLQVGLAVTGGGHVAAKARVFVGVRIYHQALGSEALQPPVVLGLFCLFCRAKFGSLQTRGMEPTLCFTTPSFLFDLQLFFLHLPLFYLIYN